MITILFDPAGAAKKEAIPVSDGTLLRDWILANYGPDGFEVPTMVFIDRVAPECELDLSTIVEDGYPISAHENVIIVHRPQGGGFFIATLIIAAVTIAIIDIPSVQLVPTPIAPENRQATESPNNSLSGQTNIVRPLQRIPDIFGKNLVYPDLILKPYFEFINHVKTQFEYMCIGRGEFLVEDKKTGDTLLSGIAGTINEVFEPFTAPGELLDVTESNEVNGQDLFGPNIEKIELARVLASIPSASVIKSTDSQMAVFEEMTGTISGTHDAGTNATVMTDSGEDFEIDLYVGKTIFNTTDSSSGVVTSNSATEIIVAALTGGSDNQWENGDSYLINGDIFEVNDSNTGTISSASLSYSGDTITGTGGVFDFMIAGDFLDITSTTSGNNLGDYVAVNVSPNEIICIDLATGSPSTFTTQVNDTSNITVDNPHGISFGTFESLSTVDLGSGVLERTINLSNSPFSTFGTAEYAHRMETSNVFLDNTTGPFNVPGNPEQIWVDIQAPRGLFSVAAVLPIKFTFVVQELTSGGAPTGSPKESSITLADNNRDPRFFTLKIIPDNPGGFYEISIKRVTDSNTDNDATIGDKTIWTRLASVSDVSVSDFGDVTTWQVITKATEQAVKIQERIFNAIATRKLPTYDSVNDTMSGEVATGTHDAATSATVMEDSTASFTVNEFVDEIIHNTPDGSQGVVVSNTATTITVASLKGGTDNQFENGDKYDIYAPTARVADAAVEMLTNTFSGNKPLSEIDLVSLYDIQDALDVDVIYGDKLGRFCYSFSNRSTSVNDELETALRACRMFKYQEGNLIKFGRDQVNLIRTTTFMRRVKKADSETKSTKRFIPGDFDGVTLDWTGEESGESETILFPEGGSPVNPSRINAAGVKNYEQAWNMAAVEFEKIIRRRTVVSTTVLRDGMLVSPNDRVGNVDSTTLATQDGEILSYDAATKKAETKDPIDFAIAFPTATVIIRDVDGSVSDPLDCIARGDGVNGFQLVLAAPFTIRTRGFEDSDGIYQIGAIYSFAQDTDHTRDDYLVQEIAPQNDGYVALKLVNYDPAVYDPDTTTPTAEP